MNTVGISPKVYIPFVLTLIGIIGTWAATGEFNREEFFLTAAAGVQAVVGYIASPGEVR